MLILSLLFALATDQAKAGIAPGVAQPGSAVRTDAAEQKSTPRAPAPGACPDNIVITGPGIASCAPIQDQKPLSPRTPVPANIILAPGPVGADQLGEDGVRFSSISSLAPHAGLKFELHRDGEGASGTRTTISGVTPPGAENSIIVPIRMSRAEYERLMAQIDVAMARNEPDMRVDETTVRGCMDGAEMVTERWFGGRSYRRSGSCDGPREEHPNHTILRLLQAIAS